MKVVHIISGISKASGGPSRSVQGIVFALNQAGVEAWLVTCAKGETPWFEGVTRFRMPEASGLKGLKAFFKETLQELQPDLVHFHGLWDPRMHVAVKVVQSLNIPYVFSPRGMLDPWAFAQKKWKKRIAWWLYQRWDLLKARAFHVTAKAEATHVRAFGFQQPIFVVPNGVFIPKELPNVARDTSSKTALFLSRLHPGKGLMTLAEAWGRVRPKGWQMRVVGFDGYGERARVEKRLAELGVTNWVFDAPLTDDEKWGAFTSADIFIHPSVSENFGISIAEALYARLPVITTKGCPWEDLVKERCGWWIDTTIDALADAIKEATDLSDVVRAEMGVRATALIKRKYTWQSIGEKMKEYYEGEVK